MIRAGKAATPEQSRYTSVYERIMELKRVRERQATAAENGKLTIGALAATTCEGDLWISPIQLADGLGSLGGNGTEATAAALTDANPFPSRRLTNKGFLPLTLEHYLSLLDWTGRQIRSDKRGSIPAELAPILDRLRINQESWPDVISGFGKLFHSAVGRLDSLAQYARRVGRRWIAGKRQSAVAFT